MMMIMICPAPSNPHIYTSPQPRYINIPPTSPKMSEKQLSALLAEKEALSAELAVVNNAIPASEACTRLYGFMNASESEGGVPEGREREREREREGES